MSGPQSYHAQSSKILLIAGSLCVLFGFFLFAQRQDLASFFLGARFLFGHPITGADAFKVTFVAIGSTVATLMGLVLAGVGLTLALRSSQVPGGTPSTHP
jgi:hypothetical protein